MNLQIRTLLSLGWLCAIGTAEAQFPNLLWEHQINAPAFGSAAAADMDNDGFYEIVFTTYTNDGKARCLNAEDGSLKWSYNIGGCGDVAPIIHDMDGDGNLDVFVNGSCNPTAFSIDGATGSLNWSVPSGGGDSPPAIADVDGDNLPEVLFFNFNGELRVLNAEDGTAYKNIQVDPNNSPIQTEPALVDINGDGALDVIGASHWNLNGLHEWAIDIASETIIWSNTRVDSNATFHAYHAGAMGDVDGDGILEYVLGSNDGTVRALNVEDGTEAWSISVPNSSNMAAITLADMDADGVIEVLFNNNDPVTLDQRIWMLDGMSGSVEWDYPIDFNTFRGMSVSDIDGNGVLDIVSAHFMGDLMVIEPNNGLVWQYDMLQFMPPGLPYFDLDHQPLIADFDQNGTLDIFVAGGYGTYTPDAQNTGKAFMVEAGIGTCPEWLMFRQDILRSGYISDAEIQQSCNSVGVIEGLSFEGSFDVYPVPTAETVYLRSDISGQSDVSIFDIHGKLIFTQAYRGSDVPIDVGSLSPGVYRIQLMQYGFVRSASFIVQR